MNEKLSKHTGVRPVDSDPDNRPAYPMRTESGDEHKGMNWERPEQQPAEVEILQSNERPTLSAVFGTSSPPSGLSGMIRRFAFRYSESNMLHWVPLMLADRVNAVEGILQDLGRGYRPHILNEMGIKAEIKHNPGGLALKIVAGGVLVYALRAYFRHRKIK